MSSGEYDFEPVRGLPQRLPPGERMLWQGAPDWRSLAVRGFHVRALGVYFAALLLWKVFSLYQEGAAPSTVLGSAAGLLALAAVAIGLVVLFSWLVARSTVYTLTTRRLVMRFGIALPMSVNFPYRLVDSAALRLHADDSGDIPLTLVPGQRISYMVTWPHTRAWHVLRPQPMLRCVPQAEKVAGILSAALAAELRGAARASVSLPRDSMAEVGDGPNTGSPAAAPITPPTTIDGSRARGVRVAALGGGAGLTAAAGS